jgi:hypothetical protein
MGAAAVIMGAAQGGLALNQANQDAKTAKAQADYQNKMSFINSQFAEMQARDAINRGEIKAGEVRKAGKQVVGAQKAALAAQGIDISSGSALEIQQDTDRLNQLDAMQVRNNAWREAWGYKVEASQATAQGQMAMIAGKAKAKSTLMTGGMTAANQTAGGFASAGYFQGGK